MFAVEALLPAELKNILFCSVFQSSGRDYAKHVSNIFHCYYAEKRHPFHYCQFKKFEC